MKKTFIVVLFCLLAPLTLFAELKPFVRETPAKGDFKLVFQKKAAVIYYDKADFKVVEIAANDLALDIERVTGVKPIVTTKASDLKGDVVIIGTLGKKGLVDQLAAAKKINVAGVAGKWEAFVLQTVAFPRAGVASALVIAGSDRRGTAYGVYELSAQIGVSPWYWWADVPAKKKAGLAVMAGRYTLGEPAVKYRGIFLNDEAPSLTGWAAEKFGGINSKFYQKVFELMLRLKANYLWPAMWGNAFYLDDPADQALADNYAIVMGTSHHEPMTRAQQEWTRAGKGDADWNYEKNEAVLKDFWKAGAQRIGNTEVIVTIGMRGNGDMPMSEKGNNIPLLEKVVADQRQMLSEVTGKKIDQIPQVWALYKEVQDYYDQGMRVPDDVTLLLCDDNYGNIRRLPPLTAKPRKGGYGIYYHFDYVGWPRNYKWVNTNPLPKIWEQMHLAYAYNARQIWIVNVGDLKPMEFPISFFLDYAWNPQAWPADRLAEYTRLWAEQQFGKEQAGPIADMLAKYAKYNGRRKPEHIAPKSYSLVNYDEAQRVVAEYNQLAAEAKKINDALPAEYRDAYFELVLYPVGACANFLELYTTVGKNFIGVVQGRASANDVPAQAQVFFDRDQAFAAEYHKIAGGKWNHMMDQTNIGYIGWQDPPKDALPRMKTVTLEDKADMAVSVEGSELWWPNTKMNPPVEPVLPEFNTFNRRDSYFEVFARGKKSFDFTAESKAPWLVLSQTRGTVDKETRVKVSVDWDKAPAGAQKTQIVVSGAGQTITIQAVLKKYTPEDAAKAAGWIETDGYVSMEADAYAKAVNSKAAKWLVIPDYGRTANGVTIDPITAASVVPGGDSPRLEYQVYLFSTGEVQVKVYLGTTLNFLNAKDGLRYAVSIDDEPPQIVNATAGVNLDNLEMDNVSIKATKHKVALPGAHTVKIWMVDPGLVVQKVVVDTGAMRPSYLGPPPSPYQAQK
jgi:hypothetical protein